MTEIEAAIIGLTGFKGSGKTTAGRMLSAALNLPVMHLADPIKEIVTALDPFDSKGIRLSTYTPDGGEAEAKAKHDQYRHALRSIGEGVRELNPTFWLESLAVRASGHRGVIVPDIRFPLEAQACDVIIHITRPGFESDGHMTERDMRQYAGIIVANNGTKADLAAKLAEVINDIGIEGPREY